MTATTQDPQVSKREGVLYLALELSNFGWKLASSVGPAVPARRRSLHARDLEGLADELVRARSRFRLPEDAPVMCCYEAGRDGFWLHRWLRSQGVSNLVVDSSSIEVNRRRRRVKTDRVDAAKLLSMLMRHHLGEHRVWSVVRIPSVEEEDSRHLHRERQTLKRDRVRVWNRVTSHLATVGLQGAHLKIVRGDIERLVLPAGGPVAPGLRARLRRELRLIQSLDQQLKELDQEILHTVKEGETAAAATARQLQRLKAIGPLGAYICSAEFFAWRKFRNRRQVGALAGLTPTPYQSGESAREQGISKSGNKTIRRLAVELAWCWLRYQPQSELALWYQKRFGKLGGRWRRIGIVALARKLLIVLWRFAETGEVPRGAILKPSV